MTNAARDFIQNELLPFARQMHAWKQVPKFIERNRHLWDAPDHVADVGKMVDPEHDMVLSGLATGNAIYEREATVAKTETVAELPRLPEKINYTTHENEFMAIRINALIDYLKALEWRQQKDTNHE